MQVKESAWFVVPRPVREPRARLFCFPYAGGSASTFNGWEKALADDIELVSVQPPGRDCRLFEPPFRVIRDLVIELSGEASPLLDCPYSIFGHSLGARIAFDLVSRFSALGIRSPDLFIASGSRAPHVPSRNPSIADLPDCKFIEKLSALGGTPQEVLNNREVMELYLPVLRADFKMGAEVRCMNEPVMDCNLAIFYGSNDQEVFSNDAHLWEDKFKGRHDQYYFNGGHFFIDTCRQELLLTLNQILGDVYGHSNPSGN